MLGRTKDSVQRAAAKLEAKGYQALEDGTAVLYGVSSPYTPGAETGIRWDDPALGITWPITTGVIVSDKDVSWGDLQLERSTP